MAETLLKRVLSSTTSPLDHTYDKTIWELIYFTYFLCPLHSHFPLSAPLFFVLLVLLACGQALQNIWPESVTRPGPRSAAANMAKNAKGQHVKVEANMLASEQGPCHILWHSPLATCPASSMRWRWHWLQNFRLPPAPSAQAQLRIQIKVFKQEFLGVRVLFCII